MVPALVERMIMPSRDSGSVASERLGLILKRPWEPAVTAVVSNMKQQMNLSQPVVFIVVQCSVMQASMPVTSRRLRFWNTMLSQIGKVVQAGSSIEDIDQCTDKNKLTVHDLTERTLFNVRKSIREMSQKHPNRKIVLLGWHTASLLNCHACLKEEVSAVICLGFPLYNMFGQRGTIDDVLCDITTPVLFVVGDRAMTCRVNDLEDARESTFADCVTSLVVVRGADDWLRLSDQAQRRLCCTQSMAERQILESICEFLLSVIGHEGSELSVSRKRTHNIAGKNYTYSVEENLGKKLKHSDVSFELARGQHYGDFGNSRGSNNPQLHGLSFNLQTGSISSVTNLHEGQRSRSSSRGHDPGQRSRAASQDLGDGSSRSITIDLSKDPNTQLSSVLSRRKSQLLPPTEKQTEDAIAAILGSDSDKQDDLRLTDADTALSTSHNPRFQQSSVKADTTCALPLGGSVEPSLTIDLGVNQTVSPAFHHTAQSNLASTTSVSAFLSSTKPLSNPVPTGFGRSFSIDQSRSFLASRSRREDRETQQATAILEQLTSSLDSGNDVRSTSPDFNQLAAGKKLQGFATSARRKSLDDLRSRTISSTRGRARVSKAKQRSVTTAPANQRPTGNSGVKTKPSVVRYILTSSGLTGILTSGNAIQSKKGSLPPNIHRTLNQQISSGSKPRTIPLVLAPSGRKNIAQHPSASVRFVTSNRAAPKGVGGGDKTKVVGSNPAATPLVDFMLGSALGPDGKRFSTKTDPSGVLSTPSSSRAVINIGGGSPNLSSTSRKQTVTISRPLGGGKVGQNEASVVFLHGGGLPNEMVGQENQMATKRPDPVHAGTKLFRITGHQTTSVDGARAIPIVRSTSGDVSSEADVLSMLNSSDVTGFDTK